MFHWIYKGLFLEALLLVILQYFEGRVRNGLIWIILLLKKKKKSKDCLGLEQEERCSPVACGNLGGAEFSFLEAGRTEGTLQVLLGAGRPQPGPCCELPRQVRRWLEDSSTAGSWPPMKPLRTWLGARATWWRTNSTVEWFEMTGDKCVGVPPGNAAPLI